MTERVLIPRRRPSADGAGVGPWWWPIGRYAESIAAHPDDLTVDGEPRAKAIVACPARHRATLRHEVAADGTVRPSLVCPREGCDWHVFGRLEGWGS